MRTVVREIKQRGLWQVAVAYGVLALLVLGSVWGLVAALELSVLYVRLMAVFAIMGLPMALLLAWALREPRDPEGRGFVVRD